MQISTERVQDSLMGVIPTDDHIDLLDELRDITINDILPLEQQGGFSNMYDDELEEEADRLELERLHRSAKEIRDELIADGVDAELVTLAETPGGTYDDRIDDILENS